MTILIAIRHRERCEVGEATEVAISSDCKRNAVDRTTVKALQHRGTEEAEDRKETGGTRLEMRNKETQTPTTRKGQRVCEGRAKKIGLQILAARHESDC
jgi:hypothetical protein